MNNSKLYCKEIGLYFVEWNGLVQDIGKWQALVNMVMNFWVPYNVGNLLTS